MAADKRCSPHKLTELAGRIFMKAHAIFPNTTDVKYFLLLRICFEVKKSNRFQAVRFFLNIDFIGLIQAE